MSRAAATALCFVLLGAAPAGAQEIRIVELPTTRIAYNRGDNLIYCTVPSWAGARANSLTTIDPVTGAIGESVYIGAEPTGLAISDSGRTIFVALEDTATVRMFDATTGTAGLEFGLGQSRRSSNYAGDMIVLPGEERAVAIALERRRFTPPHMGVVIYDGDVARPVRTPSHPGSDVLTWGGSPDRLYGYNNIGSEFGLRQMRVDAAGVVITGVVAKLISGWDDDIEYADGFIYSTNGHKVDADNMSLVGRYDGRGLVEPDPPSQLVFYAEGWARVDLRAFDMQTFAEVASIRITASGEGTDLLRWGDDGLVFRTANSQVVLVNTDLIRPLCLADCDRSRSLDLADFLCFQMQFASGEGAADCDQDGRLDLLDFLCFQTAFGMGCR